MSKWIYAKSVPPTLYVACSGGVDSVSVASILSKWRHVTLCHFGHNDHASEVERSMVSRIGNDLNIPVLFEDSDQRRPLSNKESTWRDDRYEWFHSLSGPVVTAHTLDDAVEWYMMTCLRGRGEFMSYQNKNVIRPFILTRKSELQEHAVEMNLSWWDDTTNYDPSFSLRAKVRKILVPVAEDCEPGLHTMVRRRLIEKVKDD